MRLPNQSIGFGASESFMSQWIIHSGASVIPAQLALQAGGADGAAGRIRSCKCPCCQVVAGNLVCCEKGD
jgi:hypothetical protein